MPKIKLATKKPIYDVKSLGLTKSAIETLLECPEKFKLTYVDMLAPDRPIGSALLFGNIVHRAIELALDNGMMQANTADEAESHMLYALKLTEEEDFSCEDSVIKSTEYEESFQECLGSAYAVMPVYARYWFDSGDKNINWIGLEQEFDLDFDNYKLRGKMDGLYEVNNSVWLFETKTKGHIDEKLMDTLSYELQVMLYIMCAEKFYKRSISGVCYNVIRRPQLRMRKNESFKEFISRISGDVKDRPDFYFMRFQVSISEKDKEEWKRGFDRLMKAVLMHIDNNLYYRNSNACISKYGACQYLNFCTGIATSTYGRRSSLFPELKGGG